MKNTQNKWFTLVELIVVITILAILWTIAFISLQWYSAQARDSKRISDVANIKKSLELFSLNTWKYPLPDSWVEYSFSWEVLWTQWVVWDQVSTNLSRNLNEKPIDPLSEQEYVYSTINSQTEYEVLGVYESDLVSTSPQPSPTGEGARPNVGANLVFAQQSYAATNDYPKISWTYNWIYVKTANYIFPSPSIINALNLETDFKDETTAIQSQIITWWDNNITWWTWALSDLIMTYTWVINDDSSDAEKISVIETIQSFYSWTSLASIDEIANVLSKITDEEKKDLADFIVLNSWVVRSVEENIVLDNTSCKTILDSWWSTWDWIYVIDPENNWIWFDVYCDMTTDWGGWTTFFAWINGSPNVFSHFEDTSENCSNPSNQCLRRIPSIVDSTNVFAASCWWAMVKFNINSTITNFFKNGTQAGWIYFWDSTTIKWTVIVSPTYIWTWDGANKSWILSTSWTIPVGNTFASSYDYNTIWNYCNWTSDTISPIKLYYR